MGKRISLPSLHRVKTALPLILRNVGGAFTGIAYVLSQPGLHVNPTHSAIIGAVGVVLGILGKLIEGKAPELPATSTRPATSSAGSALVPTLVVAMLVAGLAVSLAGCAGREPEPAFPVTALRPPGKPAKVVHRPITDNRPVQRYLRRERANHRKAENWQ
jgi:hypothetical protein